MHVVGHHYQSGELVPADFVAVQERFRDRFGDPHVGELFRPGRRVAEVTVPCYEIERFTRLRAG